MNEKRNTGYMSRLDVAYSAFRGGVTQEKGKKKKKKKKKKKGWGDRKKERAKSKETPNENK
jgi:hypothetical protein